jgi:hypothetical protein
MLLRSDVWTTATGHEIPVVEITPDHAWNILGYVRWHLPLIRELVTAASGQDLTLVPARMWMGLLPMVQEVCCHLVALGEVNSPDEAMDRIWSAGPVPWEEPS